jgi:hypothetical protein
MTPELAGEHVQGRGGHHLSGPLSECASGGVPSDYGSAPDIDVPCSGVDEGVAELVTLSGS